MSHTPSAHSCSPIPKANSPAGGSFSFPHESARKEQVVRERKGKVPQVHTPTSLRGR